MKIRHRLSLAFTFTLAGVFLFLSLAIYFMTREFHRREFYNRLEARVELTEKFFLEMPNLDPEIAQQVRTDFLQKLPLEKEWMLQDTHDLHEELIPYREALYSLKDGHVFKFSNGNRQGIAKHYIYQDKPHLIVVTAVDQFGARKLANLKHILFISLPFALLLSGFIGWITTKKALTPLEVNIDQARKISATNLNARLGLPRHKDEIYDFVTIFNELLERLEKSFTFQQTFISNASHEIRNPLTVITGEAEIALSADRTAASYRQSLEIIAQESDRLNALVNNLLSLARTGGEGTLPDKQHIPLGHLLHELRQNATAAWPDCPISWPRMTNELARTTVSGNALLLRSALNNLIDNACKYGRNRPVTVELHRLGNQVQWVIRDNGIGIPATELPLVLVPLFRASNARAYQGHGIGLPLVDRIIRLHTGTFDIQSNEGEGTVVTVTLSCSSTDV